MVENLPAMQETWVPSWGWENPLKKGMATHSSILGLPRWVLVVRNPPANAGDIRGAGSILWLERLSEERNGYPLQYSWASLVAQTVESAVWKTQI